MLSSTMKDDNNQLMIKILEYLECPQYLRKKFFPQQRLLEFVGLLNPLDSLHHLKINDNWEYREGVTTDIPCKEEDGCWVDIGLPNVI
jgi:predicted SPOUT superfamily RNA methylase MTH1